MESSAARLAAAWNTALEVAAEVPDAQDDDHLRLLDSNRPTLLEALCGQLTHSKVTVDSVETGLQCWLDASMRQRLLALVRVTKRLDPLLAACEKKLAAVDAAAASSTQDGHDGRDSVTLEDIIAYGRIVASHVRAPPEYADPTGTDPFCMPGFLFPCPDRLMMSRSALFYSSLVRAIPPTVEFEVDNRSRQIVHVNLSTATEKATILYTINNTTQWAVYDVNSRFFLTGPGKYTIRTYCQAEDQLPSEVTLKELDVPGPAETETVKEVKEQVKEVKEQVKEVKEEKMKEPEVLSAPRPKFGGLFLGGDDSDESSDDSDD